MENDKTVVSGGGIGFSSALTLIFIVLKLVKVIDWKWIWVLSPLWISAGIGIIFLIILLIVILVNKRSL